jgi:hypothetical protein
MKVYKMPKLKSENGFDKEYTGIISNTEYIWYNNAPHELFITEKEKLNTDLLNFITT